MTRKELLNIPGINDILQFGKFKGKSILYVLDNKPSYLVWCINNVEGFKIDERLKEDLLKQYNRHLKWLRTNGPWDDELRRMGMDAVERCLFIEENEYNNEFYW